MIVLSRWAAARHGIPRLAWGVLAPGKLLWALLTLALLVLGAEVWSLLAQPMTRPTAATQDFPPLVMVWRDANSGTFGTPWSQTFRLDYTDRCHQRLTILGHSALPG